MVPLIIKRSKYWDWSLLGAQALKIAWIPIWFDSYWSEDEKICFLQLSANSSSKIIVAFQMQGGVLIKWGWSKFLKINERGVKFWMSTIFTTFSKKSTLVLPHYCKMTISFQSFRCFFDKNWYKNSSNHWMIRLFWVLNLKCSQKMIKGGSKGSGEKFQKLIRSPRVPLLTAQVSRWRSDFFKMLKMLSN